jgi:long-chain acyl-CoA synthetase
MGSGSLVTLLDGPSRWLADQPAIVVGDRPVRTWGQLAEAVARRGAGLRERLAVQPGNTVALFAANCPEYLELLFSIWHAGAVAVPINARLHAREAAALLDSSRATACFATGDVAEALAREASGETPIVPIGAPEDIALLATEPMPSVSRRLTDDAWIFFTSGTTGRAKGARLSHGNLLAMTAAYYADVSALSPRDSIVHVAALSHASGLFSLPFVGRGASQVLPPSGRFDSAELLDLIALGERSTFFVPPTLLRRLCAASQTASAPVDRIGTVLVGAAPVYPRDLRLATAALGPCLWNGYGQGETPCTITAIGSAAIAAAIEADDDDRLASVGVARFATRVRVVDPEGQPLPAGDTGEVIVDGPTVMSGYLDLVPETADALRDGWLHTGDLGRFDAEGNLSLVDRLRDVVITGGYNVYPREVEEVLLSDPSVSDAAVIGVSDPEWGERVVAYVVAQPGAVIDEAALDRRCLESIARHKRPKSYRVVQELPRNSAGKVLKSTLRELSADIVIDSRR